MRVPAQFGKDPIALKERKLCFFDMDKTLIAGNSGVSFMRYAFRRGKTSFWKMFKSIVDYLRYRFDLLNMEKAYRESLQLLVGVREEELIQFCQEWFEEVVKNLIYPRSQETIRTHMAKGEMVAIISNATNYVVEPLAKHLGVPYILATRLEVRDGLFTGNYIAPLCFRQGKIYWAEKLSKELGADLQESTFYTDSITDLPLLERVKDPRVVNPDLRLRKLAKKRGWPIHHFPRRKLPIE